MLRFFANFFSVVFNPLLVPTALFYILLFYFPQLEGISDLHTKLQAIAFIFASTFLFAFVLIYILFKLKMVSRITLDKQEDRYVPQVLLSIVYLLIALWLGKRLGWSNGLTLTMIATTISSGVIPCLRCIRSICNCYSPSLAISFPGFLKRIHLYRFHNCCRMRFETLPESTHTHADRLWFPGRKRQWFPAVFLPLKQSTGQQLT
jgi:small-conductance mechanosensitive channel